MTRHATTRIVRLTPPGRGAIASLLVEGLSATSIVEPLFHASSGTPLADVPVEQICHGRWGAARSGEEIVVCRRDPHRIEIHCHGGAAAANAIVSALREQGCEEIGWQQWTRESISDSILAAAEIALADAPTDRTAAILWDQRCGAMRRALSDIEAHLNADNVEQATRHVARLLAWRALGCHLTTPWRVMLVGQPNVGKSSLINALVGFERSIVDSSPGTTRDLVASATAIDGWPVELVDSAGLRASTESLETAGVHLTRAALAAADLVVLVEDASMPRTSDAHELIEHCPNALCVCNKIDLVESGRVDGTPPGAILTSATERTGIDEVYRQIAKRLVPQAPEAGEAVPFLAEHYKALDKIQNALAAGRLDAARKLLVSGGLGAGTAR